MESTTNVGLPLFKHITKKWQWDPTKENWEVAISPSMYDEAIKALKKIRFTLKKKYREEVRNHFFNPSSTINYNPGRNSKIEECDEEIE